MLTCGFIAVVFRVF